LLNDSFYLALTFNINDKIYPWFKHSKDIILFSLFKKEIENFLNGLGDVDY